MYVLEEAWEMDEEVELERAWKMDLGHIKLLLGQAGLTFVQVGGEEEQSKDISTPQHLACQLEVLPSAAATPERYPHLCDAGPQPLKQTVRIVQPYVRWLRRGAMEVDGQLVSAACGSVSFNHKNAAAMLKEAAEKLLWRASEGFLEEQEAALRTRAELLACVKEREVEALVQTLVERAALVRGLSSLEAAHDVVRQRLCALVLQSPAWRPLAASRLSQ